MLQTFLACVLLAAVYVEGKEDLYSLELTTIQGAKTTMADYKGKVLLIVNVASECGYTDTNYRELVKLQSDYRGKSFTVLGFPSNDFGGQEPGTNEDVLKFASNKYDVNFPLFSKVNVVGEEASDLYKYLVAETYRTPSWNFCKYLVDGRGNILQYFSQEESLSNIRTSISYLLDNKTEL